MTEPVIRDEKQVPPAGGERGDRMELLRRLSLPQAESRPAAAAGRDWLKIGLAAVVVLQAGLLIYALRDDGPRSAPVAAPAREQAGKSRAPAGKLVAQGYVVATRTATVSTRLLGLITHIYVDEGDRVTKGQILGRLDAVDAGLGLEASRLQQSSVSSRVRAAEARLREAERKLEREQALLDRGFGTVSRVSDARALVETERAALQGARADVLVADQQVARSRLQVEDLTIRAPFDGIVTARNAQPGEVLAPIGAGGGFTRTGLCTIVDMNSREVIVDVNEQMVRRVAPGQPVQIELAAYQDMVIPGRVIQLLPQADRARAAVRVRIRMLNMDSRILPDMGVKVTFL